MPFDPGPLGPILHLLCPPAGAWEGYRGWRQVGDEGVSTEALTSGALVLFPPGIYTERNRIG